MMTYTCHYAITHQQELINNSYNGRQEIFAAQNTRGSIFAAGGQVLAETQTDADGNERRVYPYDNLFAHAVGYATNGRFGVEAAANYYLINSNAKLSDKVASDVAGSKYPGDSVVTTLDVGLQEVAAKSLGVYKGAIIVSEPSTGRILAMVSKPDFNPNEIDTLWDGLIQDKESTVLLNRVTQGLYPPGSTFKIVTALEYIRENPDSYGQYSYQCNGRYSSGQDTINCYHGSVHGHEDFTRSFAKSCNASFANIGMTLDRTRWGQTLDGLLFNQELPVSFAYNKSKLVVNADTSDSDILQASIGQGTTQITPLHLNMITCAIANGGTVMKPYLVDHVKNNEGTVIKQFSPDSYKELLTQTEAAVLTELMTAVVESGTGTKLAGLTYTAAGKTGFCGVQQCKNGFPCLVYGVCPGAGTGSMRDHHHRGRGQRRRLRGAHCQTHLR